ncbi:major facilitator superfamily domain-containing protein [Xylariaceae sp. FL0804]|nr:major facilitator superfamily domain-containing protein [Xylariaceae sp. FL0804]
MQTRQRVAEKALHNQAETLPFAKLLVVFGTLSLTLLITFIDQNGIGVTLPTIAADLGARDSASWAGTASLVANATFQMLYGRLSDIFGRKRVYLGAVAALALADLLCGLATGPAMFYVFRGVAGAGGGGVSNLAMIIVSDIVTLEQRGKYNGIIGACVGLGNVIGPFLAAAFIARATWRAFFWTLSPLAVLVGGVSWALLPSHPPAAGGWRENVRRVDGLGVLLSSAAVVLVLIPVSGGGAYFPWDSPMVIAMLAVGGLAFALFVVVEWKVARLPMMPVQMFKSPVVVVLLLQTFLFGAVYQSYIYYVPMYLQNVRGFSVTRSAAMMASMVSTQAVFSIMCGQYMSRTKRWGEVVWVGFGLWTLGSGLMLRYTRTTPVGQIAAPLVVSGAGVGCVFQPTLVALQSHVPRARRAVIISNRNFFRCLGGSAGLAASAAVLQAALRAHLPPQWAPILAGSTYAVPSAARQVDAVLDAYMAASRAVFLVQVPLIAVALLCCAFVRDRGLEPREDREERRNFEIEAAEAEARGGKEPESGEKRGVLSDDEERELESARERELVLVRSTATH